MRLWDRLYDIEEPLKAGVEEFRTFAERMRSLVPLGSEAILQRLRGVVQFNRNEQKTLFGGGIDAVIGINIGLNIGINDTQKQILLLVTANRAITATQLAGRVGIARRNIETNLAQLKKLGLLRRVGAKRNGHWEIISHEKTNYV